jgi:hypothetical protein
MPRKREDVLKLEDVLKRDDVLSLNDLSDDDRAWLAEGAEVLGCDPKGFIKFLIRQRPDTLGNLSRPNRYTEVPNGKVSAPGPDFTARHALIAGLTEEQYRLAEELSAGEISVAHQTVGIKQYVTKLQSHATAVEARLARGGLNGGVPIAPLSQMSASRQAKIADGA